jgi:hypothetical protein
VQRQHDVALAFVAVLRRTSIRTNTHTRTGNDASCGDR